MNLDVKTKVYIVVGGTSVVSAAAGAAASYFVTKKYLSAKFELLLDEELAAAKRYYNRLNKVEEFSSPTEMLKAKAESLGYSQKDLEEETLEAVVDPSETEVHQNIFTAKPVLNNAYDLEVEREMRTGEAPYIITHDEYYENVGDWVQVTLTYFEDDDVLCDERDTPVEDSDALVGDANLTRFGAGSKDNNVVYIQNDHLQIMFEVVRNKGNYAKEVLGFIEHAEHRGLRRFRSDDE